jgi:hypothetical protein
MSTVSHTALFADLRARLRAVRAQEQRVKGLTEISKWLAVSMSVLIVVVLIEWLLHGSTTQRSILYWAWLSASGFAGGIYLMPTIMRMLRLAPTQSDDVIALRVGEAYPDLGDQFCNAMQIHEQPNGSSELALAAFEQVAQRATPRDFSIIIDREPLCRSAIAAFVPLVVLTIGLTFLSTTFGAAWERVMLHDVSYRPPAPYTLSLTASADSVLRGSPVTLTIRASGAPPTTVMVHVRKVGTERFSTYAVRHDSAAVFTHVLAGLSSSVECFAEGAWLDVGVRTDTMRITVIDRPLIRTLSGRVIPPGYTMLSPTDLTEVSADVTALAGSVVDIAIATNKSLRDASIVFYPQATDSAARDSVLMPLKVNGQRADGRFTVRASGAYSILVHDLQGRTNAAPARYAVTVLQDASPQIAMITPTTDAALDPSAKLPIGVRISDDYGFSRLTLYHRLVSSRYAQPEQKFTAKPLVIPDRAATQDVSTIWDLTSLDVTPEDVFEFYLEVADNDVISGPKTARTQPMKVRLPSLDEVFAEADQQQQNVARELQELAKESEQIRKEADQLTRELQRQQTQQASQQQQRQADWQDKKKAEELLKQQQQLTERMQKLQESLEQMTEQLHQHQAISPETLQKYMELQKLMQQVTSPELQRMQEQMKKAMENMTPEQMQEAMKNFKFNEEEFKKNVERTLNLLKRIQAEQKADELAKRAEDLADRQQDLQERTQNTNPRDEEAKQQLQKKQDQLQKDLQKMANEAKELEELMKQLGSDMPRDEMQQAQQDLAQQQTEQSMQNAENEMQEGDMEKAAQQQSQASKNLQRFAQQMKQVKKTMRKNSSREAMRQMQRSINDMVELSKDQESLRNDTRSLDPSSSQFQQNAQRQQRLNEAMQNVANSMMQQAQKSTAITPEMAADMGDALQAMKDASQQLQNRNAMMASRQQSEAMSAMNSAIGKMSDALGQMMAGEGQGQGGSGQNPGMGQGRGKSPFQRLQELSGEQESINQGMQRMGANGMPTNDQQRAELGRLAAQQGRAAKAMEELAKEQQQASGGKKPIGDLQQIASEMLEVVTDMRTGSVTPTTRIKQERILSRLLNASRSMNERDFEKTRESNSGQDVVRQSPQGLKLNDAAATSQRDLLQKLREGYTKDYETLIRLYFEAMQRSAQR